MFKKEIDKSGLLLDGEAGATRLYLSGTEIKTVIEYFISEFNKDRPTLEDLKLNVIRVAGVLESYGKLTPPNIDITHSSIIRNWAIEYYTQLHSVLLHEFDHAIIEYQTFDDTSSDNNLSLETVDAIAEFMDNVNTADREGQLDTHDNLNISKSEIVKKVASNKSMTSMDIELQDTEDGMPLERFDDVSFKFIQHNITTSTRESIEEVILSIFNSSNGVSDGMSLATSIFVSLNDTSMRANVENLRLFSNRESYYESKLKDNVSDRCYKFLYDFFKTLANNSESALIASTMSPEDHNIMLTSVKIVDGFVANECFILEPDIDYSLCDIDAKLVQEVKILLLNRGHLDVDILIEATTAYAKMADDGSDYLIFMSTLVTALRHEIKMNLYGVKSE